MFSSHRFLYFFLIGTVFFCVSCTPKQTASSESSLFELLPGSSTGIQFTNTVTDTKEMSILNYHNFYNGGGVAVGDINNDGKPDVFFTSNQGDNKLYLNKGNFKFEDITGKANLSSKHKWHTGVSMVDINSDGWLDIYVCNAGIMPGDDRSNELYINQRNGSFKEQAAEYGLDDKGASTQAVFFDYDHDGDLDCFVLNNSPRSVEAFGNTSQARAVRDSVHGDRLYENQAGKYRDVSEKAGIYGPEIAFGLSVAVGDLNNDGWEDLYVANDFFERDYLYLNQQNGSFKEVINEAMGHSSNGSMGTDLADINNDGYLDLFTSEMLPENDYRLKTTIKFDEYDVQNARNQQDLHHQFTGNTLQLNNQDGSFSEIAQLAGVEATGWSWGALSFDFDNDGWKDIYVCNGILRDLTDQDFLAYFNSQAVLAQVKQGGFDFMELLNKMPSHPLVNDAFVNQKNLLFKHQSSALGFNIPSFSSGAAYADLDGDGDLDLLVNNQNQEAFVYRNHSAEKLKHHYLKIQLKGNTGNTQGLGARVTLFAKDHTQVLEQMPVRGFQSSVEPILLFGLEKRTQVDSLRIQWPAGQVQTVKQVPVDTLLILDQANANRGKPIPYNSKSGWYQEISNTAIRGNSRHRENEYVDFNLERLIPKMLSTQGPKLAIGDVNGDDLEDWYLGSASGDTAKIFLQQSNGSFVQLPQPAFSKDKYFENVGAAFIDADADGDLDLVVASGGNQVAQGDYLLASRLYLNNGKGIFNAATGGWPAVLVNASCVRVFDYNADGLADVFIGARNIPGSYGRTPGSVLLQNTGKGVFADVTNQVAPDLKKLGMVTDAQPVDIDGDGKIELVVVGDWMPVTVLQHQTGKFKKTVEIPHSSGWWNCLTVADLDGNGTPDLIAGNYGLNSNIKADASHPARLYVDDFNKNGQTESIPVYYKTDGKAYPYYLKGEMEAQIPELKKKFLRYDAYAGKGIEEILTNEQMASAQVLTVEQTQSCIFFNKGKGSFTMQALPILAQLAPVFGIVVQDLDGDGVKDVFMGGNFFGLKPQTGRLDASYGTTLLNKGKAGFVYSAPKETGLFLPGETRDMALIRTKSGNQQILVAKNDDRVSLFRRKK